MKRTMVTIAGATALAIFVLGSPVSAADPVPEPVARVLARKQQAKVLA